MILRFVIYVLLASILLSCSTAPTAGTPAMPVQTEATVAEEQSSSSQLETETLRSLKQVDDHPLYTMVYRAAYDTRARTGVIHHRLAEVVSSVDACQPAWGCSLFAALGDEGDRLYGRNFDWQFSPALLLFTDPPDGYASVSMVDIEYLGFRGEASKDLMELPLDQLRPLLEAPNLPFDGMNEKGLAIGMAAVPEQEMPWDPKRETLDQLQVIREVLDHAATVDEAVEILGTYNIDMGSVPVHYLVASASGDSALVEFYQGEMKVFRSEEPWQAATNFLYASVDGSAQGQCWRYDLISRRLEESGGRLSPEQALALLAKSSQDSTQWSVVYRMTQGEVDVVMGMKYSAGPHTFSLK